MRFVVAVVGKPRHAELRDAIIDYQSRAARYWPLEVHEVKEENASSLAPAEVMGREAKRLKEKIPAGARIFACLAGGQQVSSEQFAALLQSSREAARDIAFVIGGAFGLGEEIVSSASSTLSLAPFTLPHELARLVLTEQIYRAGTIVRGEPYHK
ncbi:MAG: 23S rRNA (pseudouridine(1915)-N(3))-methyltransferase RlmH [Gemmatimonadota bacterium]|nr:23S rRNA (pseudouridine(1915)-N(3))-methyltransferase RlmH [Gemmatimonadota bacterium]